MVSGFCKCPEKTSSAPFYERLARKTNGDEKGRLNVGFYCTVTLQRKDFWPKYLLLSSTRKFETPLYLSTGEIKHALTSDIPYDIYRLYSVTENKADMRIARDIKNRLGDLQGIFDRLPKGVRIESLAIDPNYFVFEAEVHSISDEDS